MSLNFKSEEEVKEYIKNLGIEYRFGCFKEKKPEACQLLGDYLEAIDKNYEKAWKVYQSNCETLNFARSCFKCGNYLATGKAGQKLDRNKAISYFEKSCEFGDMDGCFRAGVFSAIQSTSKDPVKTFGQAIEFLEKGCAGNQAEACHHLSGIFLEGYEKENIAKDMKRSFEYATKACSLDNMYACANLSMMYRNGDGVEKNLEMAQKYRKKAQEMHDEVAKQQQQLRFQQGLSPT